MHLTYLSSDGNPRFRGLCEAKWKPKKKVKQPAITNFYKGDFVFSRKSF